jgi:hypothetical protein
MFRTNFSRRLYRVAMLPHTPSGDFEAIGAYQQDAFGPSECGGNTAKVIKIGKT